MEEIFGKLVILTSMIIQCRLMIHIPAFIGHLLNDSDLCKNVLIRSLYKCTTMCCRTVLMRHCLHLND